MAEPSIGGYLHPVYAASLAEFGVPRQLSACRGWILERPIAGFPWHDGMGCYPLFACQDWSRLQEDIAALGKDLVTLSLVVDPFGSYTHTWLEQCFDRIVLFKEHFVVDLRQKPEHFVSSHHRRNVRRACQQVDVQITTKPLPLLDEWVRLYEVLRQRHEIGGLSAFSYESFRRQFHVPGIVAFCALHAQQIVGMTLWYISGDVAYYHLGAYSPLGYELLASFALFWHSLSYFKDKVEWLNLGGGAGEPYKAEKGIKPFIRAWPTVTPQ
jgi:hypothetical protein